MIVHVSIGVFMVQSWGREIHGLKSPVFPTRWQTSFRALATL